MKLFDKRGQTNTVSYVVYGVLALFLLVVLITTVVTYSNGGGGASGFGTAFSESFGIVLGTVGDVLDPIFSPLLGLDGSDGIDLVRILAFILVAVVVVGTLDSISLFENMGDRGSNAINFVIGIIVSIIGVRFMPDDIWQSLTAPSSAFVATLLVGLPFLAFIFVSFKIKNKIVTKLMWLFYILFMSYLVFFPESGGFNGFSVVYLIFLVLAFVMFILDANIRRWWYKGKADREIEKELGEMSIIDRKQLRGEIAKWQEILVDSSASKRDKATARTKLAELKGIYGDISSI